MRISQLNLLLALEKYGSFSKAAKELFLSQPYISATVKELEEEVGFQILERSNKGVHFTLQGNLVLDKARTILDEMDAIYKLRSSAAEKGLSRRLQVVGAPFFCNTILADALAVLAQEISDFEFDLHHANGGDILKPFSFGEADVALLLVAEINELGFLGELQKYDLKYQILYTDEMCHVARKDHPLCQLSQVTLADVSKYSQVFQFDGLMESTLRLYRKNGYRGKPMIIENFATLVKYLSVSDAVAFFVPQMFDTPAYNTKQLQPIYLADYPIQCKVLCIYTAEMEYFVENYFLEAIRKTCKRCQET